MPKGNTHPSVISEMCPPMCYVALPVKSEMRLVCEGLLLWHLAKPLKGLNIKIDFEFKTGVCPDDKEFLPPPVGQTFLYPPVEYFDNREHLFMKEKGFRAFIPLVPRMSQDSNLFVFHANAGLSCDEDESSCAISHADGAVAL